MKSQCLRKTFKSISVVVISIVLFLSQNNFLFGASDQNVQIKPVLTSEKFDNRATKIQIKILGVEKPIDLGTGFFVNDNRDFIYLVSAGHLFKNALKLLIDNKGVIVCFQKFETADGKKQAIVNYEIDLIDYWKKNLLKINESQDIGVIRLREFMKKEEDAPFCLVC